MSLTQRERLLVGLSRAAIVTTESEIDEAVSAALDGGIPIEQILEADLQLAVYLGWPKVAHFESRVRAVWGQPLPELGIDDAGLPAADRVEAGRAMFEAVNNMPAPPPVTPYVHAGVVGFVFGHVWLRAGLSRRDRRVLTLPCAGVSGAAMPIAAHVGSALSTGDLAADDLTELIAICDDVCGDPLRTALSAVTASD